MGGTSNSHAGPAKQLSSMEFARSLETILKETRKADPALPLQTFLTLIEVSMHPGSSFLEPAERMDMTRSSVSRHVAYLSKEHWTKKKPGLDMVYWEEDAKERRRKNVYLNERGQWFLQHLNKTVNETLQGA